MMRPIGQTKKMKILRYQRVYLSGQQRRDAMKSILLYDYSHQFKKLHTTYPNKTDIYQHTNILTRKISMIDKICKAVSNIRLRLITVILQIQMDKYIPLEQIGKGSFGVVRKVRPKQGGDVLVWKQINFEKMSSREKQQLVTQVNLLKQLDHPNIVRYVDRMVDKAASKVYIIMEYCSRGDLGTELKKSKQTQVQIEEEVIWKICYQLLLALQYCHTRSADERGRGGKVLHRDIKPANIFIDQGNHVKLGDFGLSRQMGEHSEFAQTHVGTPYYMSPQQVRNGKYNEKSDIWSTGCLIYELASLRRPFEASNHLALAKKIEEGKFDRIPLRYSENLFALIKQMLMVDPERRLSARELLQNPMFIIRSKQNILKQKILALRIRQQRLKQKQKELQLSRKQVLPRNDLPEEEFVMYKKKSSKQSQKSSEKYMDFQKQNRNRQNFENS